MLIFVREQATRVLITLIVFTNCNNIKSADGVQQMTFTKPEDILALEETTMIQLKSVWNLTHATYAMYGKNSTGRIKTFWNNLKSTLSVVTDAIRAMETRIITSQPSSLLNKLFELQELDVVKEASDTATEDPVINWKVKWIELSSLSTHIHWLFNKRMRDIKNNVPYIKTIANSLAKYYGNPWYSTLSGRSNSAHRYPMRDFPRWIDQILFYAKGDLFSGLRQLIDNCTSCKSGTLVGKGECQGKATMGKIEPLRLDAPIHVFFYICLVDIKFYILKNFFHIYREAYENIPYTNYSIFDDRLQTRLRKKLDAYSNSFKDYDGQQKLSPKISSGYFHCDPPAINSTQNMREHVYKKTFIKITNFGTEFVVPERELTPSGKCSGTCRELGKADMEPCRKSDEECEAAAYPECASNPRLCELFKPICPLTDLVCYKSSPSAKVCPTTAPDRLLEWALFNNTQMYPKDQNASCSERVAQYNSTMVKDSGTGKMESCEVCLCQCLEPVEIQGNKESVRLFSLKESSSLLEENRVIVGIKFEQLENQIHIMIADAVSQPGLAVDMNSVVWRKPTRADPDNKAEVARMGRNLRAIHIDDWKAPTDFVVTGIRFISDSTGTSNSVDYQSYIGTQLKVTKADTATGKLIPGSSTWIKNTLSGTKPMYKYTSPNEPTKADGPAIPDSSTNQLIYFRTTALTKTNVNEVVPYFDAQEVILKEKAFAFSGIGIYHKVKSGFGGFLGWKIMPYQTG